MSRNTTKAALILAAGAAFACTANAQRFQEIIGSEVNETAYDIEHTRDGGYVTAGCRTGRVNADGTVDPADFLVVKYDALGGVMWSTQFGTDVIDVAFSVHQTQDGGYIVAGQTEGSAAELNVALLRLDPAGSVLWSKTYRGDAFGELLNPMDPEQPPRVAVRESENKDIIVVANAFEAIPGSPIFGQGGMFIRTDASGSELVQRFYTLPSPNPDFPSMVTFTDLKEIPGGDVIISGWIQHDQQDPTTGPGGFGDLDALALRVDPVGTPMWTVSYDEFDPNFGSNEEGYGIDISPNGDRAVMANLVDRGIGVFGTQHYWIDPLTGLPFNARHARELRPSFAATRYDEELNVATAGLFGIAGVPTGPGSAISYNAIGDFLWQWTYGPSTTVGFMNRLEAVANSRECGWAMTGIKTLPLFGGEDIHLVKVNDRGSSGCFEDPWQQDQQQPEIQPRQLQLPNTFFDGCLEWGNQRGVELEFDYLCLIDTCEDPQPCGPADITTTNTNPGDPGYGVPDGQVDGADLSYYVENWLNGTPVADFTTTNTNPGDPGYGVPDGTVDGADLSYYVERWLRGCP